MRITRQIISEKEYAKICLECPYPVPHCEITQYGCERLRYYKTHEDQKNIGGGKDATKKTSK